MFCNKCGNEISPNQEYCNKCGNHLTYNIKNTNNNLNNNNINYNTLNYDTKKKILFKLQ